MNIAVFCASANSIDPVYRECARELGKILGEGGHCLVYGGTNQGLMREVAEATIAHGGEVVGIIPECIYDKGVAAGNVCNLIVAPDMKERKELLREHAEAFIALPGGWGTLEEISEVITLKQLGIHGKPVVFLNVAGFYDLFFYFLEETRQKGFISDHYAGIFQIVPTPSAAVEYILNYRFAEVQAKYGREV